VSPRRHASRSVYSPLEIAFHLVVDLACGREVEALLAVAGVERTRIVEERISEERVVALAAEQRVVAEVACQIVVAIAAVDGVVGGSAEQVVVAAIIERNCRPTRRSSAGDALGREPSSDTQQERSTRDEVSD